MAKSGIVAVALCICLTFQLAVSRPGDGIKINNSVSSISTANLKNDPNLREFTNFAYANSVQKDLYHILCNCGSNEVNSSSAEQD